MNITVTPISSPTVDLIVPKPAVVGIVTPSATTVEVIALPGEEGPPGPQGPPGPPGGVTWPLDHTGATVNEDAITLKSVGDTQPRLIVNHDGTFEWASGIAIPDIKLMRSSVGMLETTGGFRSTGPMTMNAKNINRVELGIEAGTPRIVWETPGSTIWGVDNYAGHLRWIGLGAVQMSFGPTGNIDVGGFGAPPGSKFSVTAPNGTTIPIIARGGATHTVDLQQWQNSAGTVLASISADGSKWSLPLRNGKTFRPRIVHDYVNGNFDIEYNGQEPGSVGDVGGTLFRQNIQGYQFMVKPGDGVTGLRNILTVMPSSVTMNGYVQLINQYNVGGLELLFQGWDSIQAFQQFRIQQYTASFGKIPTSVSLGAGNLAVYADNTRPGVVVKGAVGQTQDLQQWQDSNGTTVASVSSTGAIRATSDLVLPSPFSRIVGPGGQVLSIDGANNWAFKNTADARILEIYNSSGVGIPGGLSVNVNGHSTTRALDLNSGPSGFIRFQNGADASLGWFDSQLAAYWQVQNGNKVPLILKGAFGGQWTNMQEWQDTTGAVLARVANNGAIENSSSMRTGTLFLGGSYMYDQNMFGISQIKAHLSGDLHLRSTDSTGIVVRAGGRVAFGPVGGVGWAGGDGCMLEIANVTTVPNGNIVGGALYSEGGALKWRANGNGVITTLAPAAVTTQTEEIRDDMALVQEILNTSETDLNDNPAPRMKMMARMLLKLGDLVTSGIES